MTQTITCEVIAVWHQGGTGYAAAVASVLGRPTNVVLERRTGDRVRTAVIALPAGWTQTDVTIHWVLAPDAERSARADLALAGGDACVP